VVVKVISPEVRREIEKIVMTHMATDEFIAEAKKKRSN